MDTTRVELDIPVVIVNQYGHLQLDNLKDIQDLIAAGFSKGSVINVHIVAEDTGATRSFCEFVSQTNYGKSKCGFVLRSDGSCWRDSEHEKEMNKTEDSE